MKGIPSTFIIGPEGTVLWNNHPSLIDDALAKVLKEHPPQLVDPKLLAEARTSLGAAREALAAGNTKAALSAMAKVPADAKKDKAFAADADAVRADLEKAGDQMLAEVAPLIQSKQYLPAVTRLKELAAALTGSPAGEKATHQLGDLVGKPEVKAAVAKAAREEQSRAMLESARASRRRRRTIRLTPSSRRSRPILPTRPPGRRPPRW